MSNEYITVDDVRNKTFSLFPLATKQVYVDLANAEGDDLAKKRGVTDLTTVQIPTHMKIKEYLIHYAVQQLALDNADFNSKDGSSMGEDKYEKLYGREAYVCQHLKPEVVLIMFTGGVETPDNRAVFSQRLKRV